MKIGEGKILDKENERPETAERQIYGQDLLDETKTPTSSGGNDNILKKSDVLLGKKKHLTVHLEHYDKDVIIRPLSDGELSAVFDVIGNVPLNKDGLPDLNMVDIGTNLRALRMITAIGLVEPELTEDDVGEMRFGTPGILAKHILEISGLSESAGDDTEKFRNDA